MCAIVERYVGGVRRGRTAGLAEREPADQGACSGDALVRLGSLGSIGFGFEVRTEEEAGS